MNSKIAILLPANVWFCPFVKIYTDILNEIGAEYDIICWDKSGGDESGFISYRGNPGTNSLSKFLGYWKFAHFIKKTVIKNQYDKIIVFSSQIGVFCSDFLKKHFADKYIFDFRDLSIEQNKVFSKPFDRLLSNSFANIVSSPGFLRYLPSNHKYMISHNFDINEVQKSLSKGNASINSDAVDVLTIGGIRDAEANKQVMDALANRDGFSISFVGRGPAAATLEEYAKEQNYKNVRFEGFYKKEDEPSIIKNSQFLNIFYPDKISHATAISNRFYNALIYRRPMITTKGQIQGDFCEKYNLGLAVDDTKNLALQIKDWIASENFDEYEDRCINLLKEFLVDYDNFKQMLLSFVKS